MSTTWILSANRSTATIYQSQGTGQPWTLVKTLDHPEKQ
ncbi:host attachment protein [Leptospirillum ferrooxidans]|nr:host attachment protein [Leptospirillum ferrooxidans]